MMKRTLVLFSLLMMMSMLVLPMRAQQLKFGEDKKFKIVQFTDVHWIADSLASEEAGERMNEVLDAEKPDLVIYTGDVIFAPPADKAMRRALEPVIKRGIPFAVTFGNHDDEQDMNRKELYEFIKDMPGNLTSSVEGLSGVTNFVLPVKSSSGLKDAAVLYVFDSQSYSTLKHIKGYGWIKHDQVQWYIDQSKKYTEANGGTPLTSLAFFHIPLPEYHEAVRNEGSFLIGTRKENACSPEINTGLFAAMQEAGDVIGTFVGHDHVNDYAVSWKGIMLCYGRFTGGKTVYHDMPGGNGARVIELTEGVRQFRSWIRLKGGQVINDFTFPSEWIK